MSNSKRKKIVIVGDSVVSEITVLGKIDHVTTMFLSPVIHLREFATKTLQDNTTPKKIIIKQVRLIERSSEYMKENMLFVTA